MRTERKNILQASWLSALIVLQPLLDILAYWMQDSVATAAGYIRLLILVALPCTLFVLPGEKIQKRRLFAGLCVIGTFCLLHVLNGFRVGYGSLVKDLQYMLRVVQMPVLTMCFTYAMRTEKEPGTMKKQIIQGIAAAMGVYLMGLFLALITGTWNSTYGGTTGFSGWVIDTNRCANSILLVTYSAFLMYFAASSDRLWVNVCAPALVLLLLLSNGTKACYASALALMAGFAAFELFGKLVLKKQLKLGVLVMTVVLFITSIVIYPYTPRAKQDAMERGTGKKNADAFKQELLELGYDIDHMTLEEKLSDDYLVGRFQTFYYEMIYAGIPQLLDNYDIRRVLAAYNMTTDAARLIDVRVQKRMLAHLIFEDCDSLTRVVGFEIYKIGPTGEDDLENDWPAIYYYYGYLGFALYVLFIAHFLVLILKALVTALRRSYTPLNFSLMMCLLLQLGLAQMSGAVLRRPNVSIFLSLVLALIWFETAGRSDRKMLAEERTL